MTTESSASASAPGIPPGGVIGTLTAPDGAQVRYGCWPAESDQHGAVLLLHGRTEFIEKHFETILDLRARGLGVFTLDWRGQGLSGALDGDIPRGHVGDYVEYMKDLDVFVRTIVQPQVTGPLFILAHSMGAHLALRYCHDHPETIERAVLCSPLIQLETGRIPGPVVRSIVRLATGLGIQTRYAPWRDEYWVTRRNFGGNLLTSDVDRYGMTADWFEREPVLTVGPPTYGWLGAMYRSIAEIHRPGYARAITVPILMIVAGHDAVVSSEATRRYCALLPHGTFMTLPGALHEILHERDEIRTAFWEAFDRFLELDSKPPTRDR